MVGRETGEIDRRHRALGGVLLAHGGTSFRTASFARWISTPSWTSVTAIFKSLMYFCRTTSGGRIGRALVSFKNKLF